MDNKIEKFISTMRDSFIGSQEVYTKESCFHFYRILKEVFPEAIPFNSIGHIITKIGDKYYDITGEVSPNLGEIIEVDDVAPASLNKPFNIYKI